MNIKFPPQAIQRMTAAMNKATELVAAEVGTIVGLSVAATTLGWVLELLEAEKKRATDGISGDECLMLDYASLKAKIEERLKDPLPKDKVETAEEL